MQIYFEDIINVIFNIFCLCRNNAGVFDLCFNQNIVLILEFCLYTPYNSKKYKICHGM